MKIKVIRVNGTEEQHEGEYGDIARLIGADTLNWVNLRNGTIMAVDDDGYETKLVDKGFNSDGAKVLELQATKAKKPVNAKATELYYSVTVRNDHKIVGDVAIVDD